MRRLFSRISSLLLLAPIVLAFVSTAPSMARAQTGTTQTKPLDRANLDTTCAPCTNFYQFSSGGWLQRNPIPAAYSEWGSFNQINDRNQDLLRGLLTTISAEQTTASDPTIRKLGAFYATCMDTLEIERRGMTPIAPDLKRVDAIASAADVRRYVTEQHARGYYVVFNFGSTQDAKNSSEVIAAIQQGGLGLPDRDYYLKTDSASVALRTAYIGHIANDLVLIGEARPQADSDAQNILRLETQLAQASIDRVQLRDPNAVYHRKTLAELTTLAPRFDWSTYFTALHVPANVAINVMEPAFVAAVDSLFTTVPVSTWKAYYRWNVVSSTASQLSKAFVDEDFAFEQKLTGAKEQLPRYKKCVQAADGLMGEALGKAYVEKYFTPEAKARALDMVHNLEAAFRERLATRTWMGDSTRQLAYAKLSAFMEKIGYPSKWKDYSTLQVTPTAVFATNVAAAVAFANNEDMKKIGKPVDRALWEMTPPTVNAYYDPALNEIVFPAGILQPPFFDPNADDAVNYGGMGAVIGHEMTHGFDDEGAQYDAQGNLKQWFTDTDLQNFKARTAVVATQFDQYTIDSVHINGKLTLGENIADLGGLTIAYAAFEKSLQGKPRPALIDGFTAEQRFFLGWAQIWRENIRPEYAKMLVTVDPHSPSIWRVNGPLSNLPEFAKAWGCKAGDAMVRPPSEQAAIW